MRKSNKIAIISISLGARRGEICSNIGNFSFVEMTNVQIAYQPEVLMFKTGHKIYSQR
jgi:hypothetical protein